MGDGELTCFDIGKHAQKSVFSRTGVDMDSVAGDPGENLWFGMHEWKLPAMNRLINSFLRPLVFRIVETTGNNSFDKFGNVRLSGNSMDSPTSVTINTRAAASLRLRLLLPPNLATVASRDAIAVKLELAPSGQKPTTPEKIPADRSFQMTSSHAAALARIEEWCGGKPAAFMQLTREKLGQLLELLRHEACFFMINRPANPIEWKKGELAGVSPYLAIEEENGSAPEQEATPPRPSPAVRPVANNKPPSRKREPIRSTTPMEVDGSMYFVAISLPSREDPAYEEALDLVKSHDFLLEPSNRKWWLRDKHKTLVFLSQFLEDLRGRFGARFTRNFENNIKALKEAELSCEAVEARNGYEVELSVKAAGFEPRQIQESLQTGRPYLERDGRVTLLPKKKIEKLEEVRRLLSGNARTQPQPRSKHALGGADLAVAGDLLDSLLPNFEPPSAWRSRAGALGNISQLSEAPLPPEVDERLRLYQRIGTSWMYHLYQHKLAGVLADEMGLGKTLQALCLIEAARGEKSVGQPSLVVCPASLGENWRREANRFLPNLRVFLHHREERLNAAEEFASYDLIITSYATLSRDQELFRGLEWKCIVADEAQHIKNRRTQNARALTSLRGRGRFVLTGTPIENSLNDLVSLFAFLMPGYISDLPTDARGEERAWHEARLLKKAAPYILRRTKTWVAPELPEKIEQTLFCDMEESQRTLYDSYLDETRGELNALVKSGESEGGIRRAMFTRLLRLRQICCDPRLVAKEHLASDSGKLNAFREILSEAIDDGHRLLVFSQFVSVLQLLKEELEEQGVRYCYLDGQTRNRLGVCDTFNEDPGIPVFLISLKAGGTGLNLTGAYTVVHFDPWWNPAVEAQATDRAHRIGQEKVVTSIKLIATGSVEEKVLALQRSKRALVENLFEESQAANAPVGLADIQELLA